MDQEKEQEPEQNSQPQEEKVMDQEKEQEPEQNSQPQEEEENFVYQEKEQEPEQNSQPQEEEENFVENVENDPKTKEVNNVNKPAATNEPEGKNSSLPKVLAVLSLGIAGIAIFISMSVMKNVDSNLGQIKSSVHTLGINTTSLKKEMNGKLGIVNFEIDNLRTKVEKSQRRDAILELKKALVTVKEVSNSENSSDMQTKSDQLISNIESYLQDLGTTKKSPGTIEVKEAPFNSAE